MQTNVSVVVCIKNADRHIGKCISSLLDQTLRDFEIVVVEDPPFDQAKNIIDGFKEERIRYVRNQKNLGLSGSRNRGVGLAEGHYIFFTDSDCIVSKNWIEQGLKSLSQSNCVGVEGRTCYVSQEYKPTYSDKHSYVDNKTGGQFMTCNVAYRKSIIKRLGSFDERYAGAEDRDLALRAMELGRICFNPDMIVYHQKVTQKPMEYFRMRTNVRNPDPRVLLYKRFGERKLMFWRIVNPLNLAIILFPPLILTNLLYNSFRTKEDFDFLPYAYFVAVFERLRLWKTCAKERVFLI